MTWKCRGHDRRLQALLFLRRPGRFHHGFTGTDNQGLQGIEAAYDNVLQGVPGKVVVAKNAYQTDMPFDYETQIEPQDGSSLVLTIDESIQAFVERSLETAVQENDVGNRPPPSL